jgi:hypothetical protein
MRISNKFDADFDDGSIASSLNANKYRAPHVADPT